MATAQKIPCTLIPGDGIGPEVTEATLAILEAVGAPFEWDEQKAGMAGVAAAGDPLPKATLESIRKTRLALKGPLATPVGGGFRSSNVRLREEFQLYANLRTFRDHCHVDFREEDCWRLPAVLAARSVNIYFYDGAHSRHTQRDALVRFADVFTDPFVLLVDDWNFDFVQEGTRQALDELEWSVHTEWCRRTAYNGDPESWWNGLFVAVVEKGNATSRRR